mgnify:CR=1 FL=1
MGGKSRELSEGYRALRHNAFWQWLLEELEAKRQYLHQELLSARTWESCCRAQGGLLAIQAILGQVATIREGGEEE